ncbi:LL-diaminopimelate aminotransferase [Microaerobacter geothermalis]|uniref:LL-diaminopimelate aminotransferase n=1 Tax=Microaerobacter geothermalis TaxID=674972 RepID=UPI0022A71A85
MYPSQRLTHLTSAIFTTMNQMKKIVEQKGIEVIDLGIGSPDLPPAPHVRQALQEAVAREDYYGYPTSEGLIAFRQSVANWINYRFGVRVNPENEVLALMGSQDGLAHLTMAWIDPGDVVLVPDPGYPIYAASVHLAGGEVFPMPLKAENQFLPELENIPDEIKRRAKLMILNYPNNPVAATADLDFFSKVVSFAKEHQIIVAHDLAYSEMAFDGYNPPSFLQAVGAKDVGVEFNSLSKSFNMAGCRIGYVIGNQEIIKPLAIVKSNIDYGVFTAVQQAAIAALDGDREGVNPNHLSKVYEHRRNVFIEGLNRVGWFIPKPKATMFVWAPIPSGWDSFSFASTLLKEAGVVVIPGNAFGQMGEGYVRIALVRDENILKEVVRRIDKCGIFSRK